MTTRSAIRIHRFGGPEVLKLEQLPIPEPGPGEVLLRVLAASINPIDCKIRQGGYPMVKQDQLPIVLGRDAAGTVERCGPGVRAFREGEAAFVFLTPDRGGCTTHVLARAEDVAAMPNSADAVHAGAVPLAATTAWQGLIDHGGLQAGQRVLIHGGAGGVGHFAVQIAKAKGAHVIATVGGQDLDFARQLGADEVIDYRGQPFEQVVQDIDLVFDLIAGETQVRSWQVLKRGGALISTLQKPDPHEAQQRGVRAAHFMAKPHAATLRALAGLIDAGKIRVHVSAVFPLEEARQAHEMLEDGRIRGKIVLKLD